MIQGINRYLNRAKELWVTPNFFMSLPYLLLSGGKVVIRDGWIGIVDGEQLICPPLPFNIPKSPVLNLPIWASFPDNSHSLEYLKLYNKELLDYQYIYDPTNFINMRGGAWETFRKNCRKFPNKYPDQFSYVQLTAGQANLLGVNRLMADWLEERMDSAEDAEFLVEFALNYETPQVYRKYLVFNDEIVALNAWDMNYKYINYRLNIVKKDIPFLSEFSRWLFYTDNWIHSQGLLVNDGGNLGNPLLAKFKEKLNPKQINKVYTLTPK